MLATAALYSWDAVKPVLISALTELPALPRSLADWKQFYLNEDPLATAAWFCLFLMFECWLVSVITNDFSQVDRQWSLVPFVYAWHFALHSNPLALARLFDFKLPTSADITNPRTLLIAVLATAWGLRLTFNFWRKGGYSHGLFKGEEDYRWVEMKKFIPMPAFHVFNVVFIASQQHALLLAIVLPAFVCLRAGFRGWTSLDAYAGIGFVLLLILETITDQQQWDFQTKKYAVKGGKLKLAANDPDAEDIKRGFLTRGIFRYSRHANFLAEQAMWWAVYLFSVAATSKAGEIEWVNWSATGALNLTLLFQGSTWVTEWFSIQKYPEYKVYQKRVSRFLPLPPDDSIPWTTEKKK